MTSLNTCFHGFVIFTSIVHKIVKTQVQEAIPILHLDFPLQLPAKISPVISSVLQLYPPEIPGPAKMTRSLLVLCVVAVLLSTSHPPALADVLVGSCVLFGKNYKPNCESFCKNQGFKGGHCGSVLRINCWCET